MKSDFLEVNRDMHRLIGLDGLRGILALIVAYSHAFGHLLGWNSSYRFMDNASFCVDVFFAMSGVVLYYAYSRRIKNSMDFVRFIKVRFYRLWPVHILTMFITLLVLYVGLGNPIPKWTKINDAFDIFLDASLLSAIGIFGPGGSINQPAWSISIEMWVGSMIMIVAFLRWYLLIPLLVMGGAQFLVKDIGASEAGYKVYDYLSSGAWRCIISMSIGVISYIIFLKYKSAVNTGLATVISSVAVFIIFVVTMGYHPEGIAYLVLVSIVGLGLVWLSRSSGWIVDLLETKPLKSLGAYSFSLYLIHTPIIYLFIPFKASGLYGIVIAHASIVLSVFVSKYLHLYVEQKYSKKWSSC